MRAQRKEGWGVPGLLQADRAHLGVGVDREEV